jgi:hypothetical protein
MKMTQLKYGAWMLGIVLLLAACKKNDIDLKDPVPQILSVSIFPTNVVEYTDSIVFSVTYRDGDGDLGENSPTARNLFLTDNRINVTEEFRIRELAPQGAEVPITGTLKVVLRNTGITDGSTSQAFNYTLSLRDRAGHDSAPWVTEQVTVRK